jgi:hypothetical protein
MPTPLQRTPLRPARGLKADLDIALSAGDLLTGELVWAQDLAQPFVVEDDSGNLVFAPAGGLSLSDQAKLDGIEPNANAYVLPPATTSLLGGIKADGTSCQVDPDGTLHALGASSTPGAVSLVSGAAPITVTNGTTTPLIGVNAASTAAAGVVQLADQTAIDAGTAGRVVDAAQLKASGPVPAARLVSAGTGLSGGGALNSDITLAVAFASQAQAEAGSAADVVMSPLRTAQAVAGKVNATRLISAGTGLLGGGDLSADRSLSVAFASQAQAQAGLDSATSCSPLRVHQAISARTINDLTSTLTDSPLSAAQGKALNDNKVPNSRQVIAGTGLSGGGDLSASRTLAVAFASQAQAEAGSAADVVMSPLRTAQAVAGKVNTTRLVATGSGLSGGGNLTADRTLALSGQALALHQLASNGLIARTGSGTVTARTITGANGITVASGDGVSANPVISPAVASQGEAEAGTSSTKLMTPERVAQAIAALGPAATVVLEVFTASGTFAKQPKDIAYWVEVISGGGSGARSGTSDPAGGGGGGGMVARFIAASAVASTEAVTVGAGGGGVTALGGANGNPGGTSSFGMHLGVFGGRGGVSTGNGGAGGGVFDPDAITLSGNAEGGFIGGASAQPSVYGGGGGNGAPSMFGGGGGGRSSGSGNAGGSSLLAGSGGAGGTTSSGQGGQVPGGGGGATQTGSSSGAGGRGEVRIYRIQR